MSKVAPMPAPVVVVVVGGHLSARASSATTEKKEEDKCHMDDVRNPSEKRRSRRRHPAATVSVISRNRPPLPTCAELGQGRRQPGAGVLTAVGLWLRTLVDANLNHQCDWLEFLGRDPNC